MPESKQRHTRGPWFYSVATREIRQCDGVIVGRCPEWGVCSHMPDATLPNGTLMAAAPEMLNAMGAFFCDEIHHLVVNGHLLNPMLRGLLEREVLAKLPEIYEVMRIAFTKATPS